MRMILFTVATMGGLVLITEFALVDTARLHKEVESARQPVTVRFETDDGTSYRSKILPRIRRDLERGRVARSEPAGRIAALGEMHAQDPQRALAGLRRLGTEAAVRELWRLLGTTADPAGQVAILETLARMPAPGAQACLRRVAGGGEDTPSRRAARELLGRK